MSWLSNVVDELRAKVATAWPETDDQRMMGQTAATINWREAISAGEEGFGPSLLPPFAVVEIGAFSQASEYGDGNDAYTSNITLIYVTSSRDGDDGRITARDMQVALLEKGEAMRSEMMNDAEHFQVIDQVTWDASVSNRTNQMFLKRNHQLIAVEVSFQILAGVSSEQ